MFTRNIKRPVAQSEGGHRCGLGDGDGLHALVAHTLELAQHRGRPAQLHPFVGQGRVGHQRGHEEGTFVAHGFGTGLVEQVAVLDAAHAGAHRALDAFGAVGVRRDR